METRPSHIKVPIVGEVIEVDGHRSIYFKNKTYIQHFLKKCQIGDDIYGEFTSRRPKRSIRQNNYYHLYLSLISESSGHTSEELHTWAKGKFLTTGVKSIYGEVTRMVKSTTELTIDEFCEYMNNIQDATGVPIPDSKPFLLPLTHDEYGRLKEAQKQTYRKLKSNVS